MLDSRKIIEKKRKKIHIYSYQIKEEILVSTTVLSSAIGHTVIAGT